MSKKGKNFLIFALVLLLGVGTTAVISKGFKNWNVKDNWEDIFGTSSSQTEDGDDTDNENKVLEIDFANAYGISSTITHQEFTNKKEDGTPGNAYLGFTNQGRIYQNKFVVGHSNARDLSRTQDVVNYGNSPFVFDGQINNEDIIEEMLNLYSEIYYSAFKNDPTEIRYANYVYVDFSSGFNLTDISNLSFTYTFMATSKTKFIIEPFLYNDIEGARLASLTRSGGDNLMDLENASEEQKVTNHINHEDKTVNGKIQQTVNVDYESIFSDMTSAQISTLTATEDVKGFGLAIFGNTTDNRLTVESMKVVGKDFGLPTTQKIGDHDYNYQPAPETEDTEGVNVLSSSKMNIKKTASGTDTDGRPYVTMSYTLLPANTTDTSISAQVAWTDGSIQADASVYLKAELDYVNQTLKVTSLKDFSSQMKVTLKSVVDSSKNAVITFDLGQKFLGWKTEQIEETYYMFFDRNDSGEDKKNYEPAWWNDYTNGFSSSFTIPTSKDHSINDIEVTNSRFYFGDDYQGVYPSLSGSYMSQYSNNISFPKSLTAQEFYNDINEDLLDLSFDAPQIINYLLNTDAQTTFVGVKLDLRITATYGGVQSMFDLSLIIAAGLSDLILQVPLSSITPEISSYVF